MNPISNVSKVKVGKKPFTRWLSAIIQNYDFKNSTNQYLKNSYFLSSLKLWESKSKQTFMFLYQIITICLTFRILFRYAFRYVVVLCIGNTELLGPEAEGTYLIALQLKTFQFCQLFWWFRCSLRHFEEFFLGTTQQFL